MEFRYELRYQDDLTENEKDIVTASDNNNTSKKNTPHTWGTAISFGFRRRNASGIPMPVTNYSTESVLLHPRSKSAGPEHNRRRDEDGSQTKAHNTSSGRSTPRLAPPKKEATGMAVRTNRFGFRHPQPKYTDKVGDICSSHSTSHYNQDKLQRENDQAKQHRVHQVQSNVSVKPRSSPVITIGATSADGNRKTSNIPEPVGKYTLHTRHLPLPQYAIRMTDANSKVAKTAANQSRKVSAPPRVCVGSKDGSGTEDSGIGSQHGFSEDGYMDIGGSGRGRRDGYGRPRNLRMVVNGKSFDVRDVDDDSTVTEISVIPLPKTFASPNLNTGLVRERTTQYQRILNKDNRYNDSTTSMSTTSSEGYDEGLGEEKVYKDRSHSEKIPSIKSDFSPVSSDDPEYGHGEAMADEYSLSSSEECRQSNSSQYMKEISNAAKNGTLPKNTLRSVLLTIEDPAFAAVAATSTTLIDDETSPVDSLFDSPTISITQSDGKTSKKECIAEKSGNVAEDDSPGTPTNASNSLSLSEGREYFDDEIADQPGLVFDDTLRGSLENQSGISQSHTDNTLVESNPKINKVQRKSVENSPMHGRKLPRTRSIDTLSSCESIASDDLMMDYERSDTSSCGDTSHRINTTYNVHDANESVNSLETQEEAMREWISMMGVNEADFSSANNNIIGIRSNYNNNHTSTTESGISNSRTSRLLRNRSGADSPKSVDSVRTRQVFSPLRTPRNVQSPSIDSGDEGSLRMDRGTYQYMFQDIVSIKTMLLKLKRVLQESGENGLTRAESLNPFDNSAKNGLFYNLNEEGTANDASSSPGNGSVNDEIIDLRRQVVFLQGQLEDKDRTIQSLQSQIAKYQEQNNSESQNSVSLMHYNRIGTKETCNAATQTEKIRPVSAGPSLLQSLPQDNNMGPLVSWSDSWDHRRPPALAEFHSDKSIHKSSDRDVNRTSQLQKEQSYRCHDEKFSMEISPIKRIPNGNDVSQSPDSKPLFNKFASSSPKSAIPTPRRLTTPTLIPRSARAVSATGRSQNT